MKNLTADTGISVSGAGVGLITWLLPQLGVELPEGAVIVLFVVAVAMLVVPWVALLVRRWKHDGPEPPSDDCVKGARGELVAIIEDGKGLHPNFFTDPQYAPYDLWVRKTARFLEVVFGPLESQRFAEAYSAGDGLAHDLGERVKRLANLRDRPDSWEIQVDADGLLDARFERRSVSEADRILTAVAPSYPADPVDVRAQIDALLTQAVKLREALMFDGLERLEARQRYFDWWVDASKVILEQAPAYVDEWENAGIGKNLGRQASVDSYRALLEAKREALTTARKELGG